tara:strand:+ start:1090 stop:2517 length:1428 start_codon:yes stop_codon:yes gene_type:complete
MKHVTILLSLLTIISLKADDILVNESGLEGTYTTISAAVEAASPGDRILIAPQISPYKEDTLFIDKSLTLMPVATNSYVSFEGHIKLILDDIDNLTIIGFREPSYGLFQSLFSTINDNATNNYSIVHIIDCKINTIDLSQPKTSLYLSYSAIETLAFAHGNIIGNQIYYMFFGLFDYSIIDDPNESCTDTEDWECDVKDFYYYWNDSHSQSNALNEVSFLTECELLQGAIPFGEVNTLSDTCLIVANYFLSERSVTAFSHDFPFDLRNNYFQNNMSGIAIYLMATQDKGTNQIINNTASSNTWLQFNLAFCDEGGDTLYNFSNVSLDILNNDAGSTIRFYSPHSQMNANSFLDLPFNSIGKYAFNASSGVMSNIYTGGVEAAANLIQIFDTWFDIGPTGGANPSLKYLNLDLTPNAQGWSGGSHSWNNYHSSLSYSEAGHMPDGSKARITYLNLPTQILDPATNINIKARSVHGN